MYLEEREPEHTGKLPYYILGVLAGALVFIAGCTYTTKKNSSSSIQDLMNSMSNKNHTVNSMKALASVSMRFNGSNGVFPEAIVINKDAMRLETLNIFYQPMLIIIYNNAVAVLDTGTGKCSISNAAETLAGFTHIDVPPDVFEKLITGRLPGDADRSSGSGGGVVVSGKRNDSSWRASVDHGLLVRTINIEQKNGIQASCEYSDYAEIDGVSVPLRVRCRWEDNRLDIHYEHVKINVPVDPSLMDTQKLCGNE